MFMTVLERAYANLSRKGQYVYDLRKLTRRPFFERHVEDYRRRLRDGADRHALLDGHELVALEIESLVPDEHSSIPGRAFLTLEEAHNREFQVESEANPLQLAARETRDLTTMRRALDATLSEIATLKQYARALQREIAAKEMLGRHAGYAQPMGAA